MILRTLTMAAGIAGAAATSQFPEYSQQYLQRLGGAVDALHVVVSDFDASAEAAGLSRSEALAQMEGTAFLARRQDDMARTIQRHEVLAADLAALQGAGPFMRAYHAARLTDGQIARAAWQAYQPALPLNFAGAVFAGAGLLAGMAGMGVILWLGAWPRRLVRRRKMAA